MTDQLAIHILETYIRQLKAFPDTEEDIEAFKYAIEAIRERYERKNNTPYSGT